MFKLYFILAVFGLSIAQCAQPSKPNITDKNISEMTQIIKGQLVDSQNRPIANASVAIVGGPDSFPEIAAITDSKGSFQLAAGQKSGVYTIEIHTGDVTKKIEVTLPQSQEQMVFVIK